MIDYFQYELPLKKPWVEPTRKGFVVTFKKDGITGFGEVAPVPGYSTESFAEAAEELRLGSYTLPSVIWGVELAKLSWRAQKEGVSICKLLSESPEESLKVNALHSIDDIIDLKPGSCVKIKVGRASLEEEIAAITPLIGKYRIRLDANRAWDLKTALAFASVFAPGSFEYIEEPLDNYEQLSLFYKESAHSFALDETLHSQKNIPEIDGLVAIIIKPTLIGSLDSIYNFVKQARERSIDVVFSAAFESGIGTSAVAHLAAAWGTAGLPVGLDTYSWFAQDLLSSPLDMRDGILAISTDSRNAII